MQTCRLDGTEPVCWTAHSVVTAVPLMVLVMKPSISGRPNWIETGCWPRLRELLTEPRREGLGGGDWATCYTGKKRVRRQEVQTNRTLLLSSSSFRSGLFVLQ